jgi:hypothetical protein
MIEDHSYLHPTTRASAASSSSSCCVLLQHTNSWPSVSSPRAIKPLVSFLPSKYPTAAAARKNNTNARATRANCSSCTTQGSWSSRMMCEEDKKTI